MATLQYEKELLEEIRNLPVEQVREVWILRPSCGKSCNAKEPGYRENGNRLLSG